MFEYAKSDTALIREDGWPDDRQYTVVPTRPALRIGALCIELALRGETPAFEFGYGAHLGDPLMLFAREASGLIVPVDLEELFPGDFEANADYQRLLRYTDVAVEETFVCADSPSCFVDSNGPWNLEGYCFECPPLRDAPSCVDFAIEKLRFWHEDAAWDGITRVEDAIASGALPRDVWEQELQPVLRSELRLRAIAHCLDAIPEADDLLRLMRRYYEGRVSPA